MAVVIPPGFAQVTVKFVAGGTGRACASVFGVAVASLPTQTDVDAFSTGIGTQYKNLIKSPGSYSGLRLLAGQDGGDPVELNSAAGAGAGGAAVESVPPACMVLIKKTTALAGRHHRGRTFIPDIGESTVNKDGSIQTATLAAYQAIANDLFGVFSSGPVFDGMYLLHSSGSMDPDLVTTYTVEGKIATLRPRYVR